MTQERLKELLDYDPKTGVFTRRRTQSSNAVAGNEAGGIRPTGYRHIYIDGRSHGAHRLAWLYVYGAWPQRSIDHINGIRNDNRINNLRDVDHRTNCQNRTEHRSGHLVGCYFKKSHNKWKAKLQVNGRLKHLGYYNTEQEAHQAYMQALREAN